MLPSSCAWLPFPERQRGAFWRPRTHLHVGKSIAGDTKSRAFNVIGKRVESPVS